MKWLYLMIMLLAAGVGFLGCYFANPRLLLAREEGPPPNWGNPPLYPGAQNVSVAAPNCSQAGQDSQLPITTGAQYLRLPDARLVKCADKQITFSVPDDPEVVLDWYRARLAAQGWHYSTQSKDIWTGEVTTTGFWHYSWGAPDYSSYELDVDASAAADGSTYGTIMLGTILVSQ